MTRPPTARIASGLSSTKFSAAERMSSMLSAAQRSSNWTLTPGAQPRLRNSSRKARTRICLSASPGAYGINTPIRRMRRGGEQPEDAQPSVRKIEVRYGSIASLAISLHVRLHPVATK